MIDLDLLTPEFNPSWAQPPTKPRLLEIRRGVLYTGIEPEVGLALVNDRLSRVVYLAAAIGPDIFFGRSDGPFVPYDVRIVDENTGLAISKRDWPWNLGDAMWMLVIYAEQPVFLTVDRALGLRLLMGGPTNHAEFAELLRAQLPKQAHKLPGSAFKKTAPRT